MPRRVPFAAGVLLVGLTGCSFYQRQASFPVQSVALDDQRVIELHQYVQHNRSLWGKENNFTHVALYVKEHENDPGVGGVIARVGEHDPENVAYHDFSRLQVRTNHSRDRVWVIDPTDSRVIGTLDCITGYITSHRDPPPEWATPFNGVVLDQVIYR